MQAQDLEKHQWKERIIVVSSPNFDSEEAIKQLQNLKGNLAALKERKLVVYHLTNKGFSKHFSSKIYPLKNSESKIESFNVALFGLDGSEKYSATKAQPVSSFFGLIDQMPMRKQQMKKGE